jgi:hypothetical protein
MDWAWRRVPVTDESRRRAAKMYFMACEILIGTAGNEKGLMALEKEE